MLFYGVTPFSVEDICQMVDGHLSIVSTLDEYVPLTAENCKGLQGATLYKLKVPDLIADATALSATRELALLDVVNAGTWIGVVIILEVDVWFQLKGIFEGLFFKVSKLIKIVLYSTLLICAGYWGLLGVFLDFWDAFLWLLAFAFIEMNLFQWQQETHEYDTME